MLEIAGWTLLLWLHGKVMLLQSLTFYNAPKSKAIDNGSNSGPFTIQGTSNLQWRDSFLIALPSWRRSWTLGNVLLGVEFWLLATNFICTHIHDRAISVCIHALIGLEILRDWVYDLMCKKRGCFSLRIGHKCCASEMERTWSRVSISNASKNA